MPESAVKTESVAIESAEVEAASAPAVWASIQATLAAIRLDCAIAPAIYLEDTVVPHGGE
jgi:hypothetical protein